MPNEPEPAAPASYPVMDYLAGADEGAAAAAQRLAKSLGIDLEDVRAILSGHGPLEPTAEMRGESQMVAGGPGEPAAETRGESAMPAAFALAGVAEAHGSANAVGAATAAFALAGVAEAHAFANAVGAATAGVIPSGVITRADVTWNVEEAERPHRTAMTDRQLMIIAVVLAAAVIGALPAELRTQILIRLDIAAALGALMEMIRRAQQ